MEHNKKMIWIVGGCTLLIGCFSAYILIKSFWPGNHVGYEQITMEQAAEYMEYETDYILLDVRTMEEYEEGHIPGAVCIPQEVIVQEAPAVLTDPEQMIYVYCRSGNRSKTAAQKLCELGYVNVTEIGGILDWKGETEKKSERGRKEEEEE